MLLSADDEFHTADTWDYVAKAAGAYQTTIIIYYAVAMYTQLPDSFHTPNATHIVY